MPGITLSAASALLGVSTRTVRRWIDAGSVVRTDGARTMVAVASLLPRLGLALAAEDIEVLLAADAGDANAQAEMALVLMEAGRAERAVPWLERAAEQGHSDAMHWLARWHIDHSAEHVGLMWLARSAAAGHAISAAQMRAVTSAAVTRSAASRPAP